MSRTPYPTEFYTADKLFEPNPRKDKDGNFLPIPAGKAGGEWGSLTDGPVAYDDLIDAVVDAFQFEPELKELRIWHYRAGAALDVTAEIIGCIDWPESPPYHNEDDLGEWKAEQRAIAAE